MARSRTDEQETEAEAAYVVMRAFGLPSTAPAPYIAWQGGSGVQARRSIPGGLYEAHHGARAEPYRLRYRLEAPSEQDARSWVVAEFERMHAVSSVGWTQLIMEIVVEPAVEP